MSEDFRGMSWNRDGSISDVNCARTIGVKEVYNRLWGPVLKGHIIEYISIVVWCCFFDVINVADEEGSLEVGECKLSLACVAGTTQEYCFPCWDCFS